jgi:aspartate aminotransferase
MRDRTISTFAFTKAYAMDGWRLGYVAAKKEFVDGVYKIVLNETTHPNVFAQEGARAAVVGSQECVQEMVEEDRRRRDLVHERLNGMPKVRCHEPQATIYAFPDFGAWGKPSTELAEELLKETHVATEAGTFYGASGEGHLRICFGSEPYERLEEAMDRIESYLKKRS